MSPDLVGWVMLAAAVALPAAIVFSLGRRWERWQSRKRTTRLLSRADRNVVLGIARTDAEAGARTIVDLGERRRGA